MSEETKILIVEYLPMDSVIVEQPSTMNLNKYIPSISVAAHAKLGDRDGFLAVGMSDYLSKPKP
ncbi:response regulator [Desulfonatronum thiodismutans]|uniref:response regulator n=1 Tax=Desulfonatronum thiodismutans TaxID=159290 RepID=UPI0004ABEE8A|nr:response regulator [Desulfonatronum thiodismutans]